MKKTVIRLASLLCVFALVICHFAGCGSGTDDIAAPDVPDVQDVPQTSNDPVSDKAEEVDNSWVDELSGKSKDPNEDVETEYKGGGSAVVGVNDTNLPDPFCFAQSKDTTVTELIMVPLLEKERTGYIVQNGIDGEVFAYGDSEYTYNGIASVFVDGNTLKFTLSEDVYFSDGVNLTADDVIFTMYVLADPSYDGYSSFGKLPIAGLTEYRGNMQQKWRNILNDLATDEVVGGYTDEERTAFTAAFDEAGIIFTREIVQGCVDRFADEYCSDIMGVTVEQLMENEGLQVAFSQYFWDYSTGYGEDGLWYDVSGKSYDLIDTYPTVEEYWKLILDNHGYDIGNSGINYEKIGEHDFEDILLSVISESCPQLLNSAADENAADRISGIEKTGMYSFEVTLTELTPNFLNSFCFYVAPLHHYGSREEYKYSENSFGFEKGNLSQFRSGTESPLGAGAYKFDSTDENGDITLKRNKIYYKGCPNVETLIVTTNTEGADIYYKAYAGEGAYTGTYKEAETNTYVVIGMNAELVCVGEDKRSDASVSLRKAFATAFEAYRDLAVEQWENSGVESVTDDLYWSNDFEAVTRNTKMKVIALLKDAGYIWDDEQEAFIEAPEGASMDYEVKLYGYDAAYIVLSHAKSLFAEIGINLEISEQSTRESLGNIIEAGEAQMWVMQIDDFTTDYVFDALHSEGSRNYFSVSSKELDERIELADSLLNNDLRATAYGEIISDIVELGVIVPIYKRIDAVIYSEMVIPESITDDITSSWSWVREVHLLEIKQKLSPVS
ncbi:MAG: hypothetical protein IJO77_08270 [Oscillospiraceae bacterium]|nr:hypothetical protein [Oscillospiraceae bacterium]